MHEGPAIARRPFVHLPPGSLLREERHDDGSDAKITFGTGAFALCITGAKPLRYVASGL